MDSESASSAPGRPRAAGGHDDRLGSQSPTYVSRRTRADLR